MGTSGNFDKLCEAISNLGNWKCLKECEIQKSVNGSMVSPKSVFVVAIIDSYLDGDRSINEADDSRWDSYEVGVSLVGSTSKSDN